TARPSRTARASTASAPVTREADREPDSAEERGERPGRNRRVAPRRVIPKQGTEGQVQRDCGHRDRGHQRHPETGRAPPLPPAQGDDGRMDERKETEECEARQERNCLNGQEDEEACA